jgi:GMP synthase (glutamine-hydrolysing)
MLSMSDVRLLVLVTGQTLPALASRRGDYPAWIREKTGDAWSGAWATHDVRTAAPMPRPLEADAFVITGSSSSVTERAPWMLRTEALIREIASARRPLLGICFGHQIVAQALGGLVTRNPRGREMGAMRVSRTLDDRIFAGLPRAFDIHGTHVDAVTRLPPGAEVLATTPRDPHAAFRVGPWIKGVQFHPEFDADVMRGYLDARADIVRAEGGDPDALLAGIHVPTRGIEILRNFARDAQTSHEARRASPGTAES